MQTIKKNKMLNVTQKMTKRRKAFTIRKPPTFLSGVLE